MSSMAPATALSYAYANDSGEPLVRRTRRDHRGGKYLCEKYWGGHRSQLGRSGHSPLHVYLGHLLEDEVDSREIAMLVKKGNTAAPRSGGRP